MWFVFIINKLESSSLNNKYISIKIILINSFKLYDLCRSYPIFSTNFNFGSKKWLTKFVEFFSFLHGNVSQTFSFPILVYTVQLYNLVALQCNFPDVGPFQFGTKSAQSIFTLSRIGPKKFNKCLKINSDELLLRNKQF